LHSYAQTYKLAAMDTTAENIKKLRNAGLSQSEIARRCGIPQPRLSRWEAGDIPNSADDALKLAELARAVATRTPTEEVN